MNQQQQELFRLTTYLASAWSQETTADPEHWDPRNPAWGQCAVTALTVQDFFGGDILRSETVGLDGRPGPSHYFNRLPSGVEVDLTRQQFHCSVRILPPNPRSRQQVLASYPRTMLRYGRLLQAVAERYIGRTN